MQRGGECLHCIVSTHSVPVVHTFPHIQVRTKLSKILGFWSEQHVFDAASAAALDNSMTQLTDPVQVRGGPGFRGGRGAYGDERRGMEGGCGFMPEQVQQ